MNIDLKFFICAVISAIGCGPVFTMAVHFWQVNGGHSPLLFVTFLACAFFGPVLLGRYLTKMEYLEEH